MKQFFKLKKFKIVFFLIFSIVILIGVIYLGFYAKNKLDWNKRVSQANQSDLYGQQTNGIENDELIQIARQYIESKPSVYLNDNLSNLSKADFGPDWFVKHAPEGITYNPAGKWKSPYDYLNDKYIVYWRFMPGCEKRPEDKVSAPNWFDARGLQCLGGYGFSVIIDKSLKPQRIDINTLN
ncbi:MAG: hypothetical protein PHF44_03390 [Candidatus Pacebacteria bacterium]|nr:hypothetical protein [Candidatus Paceibacterota bacterium]